MTSSRRINTCGSALAFVLFAAPAWCQPPAPAGAAAVEVVQFVRAFVPDQLRRLEIAGAAVAVVQNGQVSSIAFGVADPSTQAPIDPDLTRFHIASVTKLVTAIAVMQQVEAGRLRLDDDVGGYLPPKLAGRLGGRGIRVRDLLTHTAGLADRWVNMAATSPDGVLPLEVYLERRLPPILDTPGTIVRYSNYGFTLAGDLVERVSGRRFADYVSTRILAPIGALHSYIGPRAADAQDARGFFYRDIVTPEPRVFEHTVPAGGAHATVTDLARVVAAVLGDGSFGAGRLISPESALAIRSPQFAADPSLPAWGFGIYSLGPATRDLWVAGGEIPGFSTRVLMAPRHQLAVVVSVNRKDPSLALALFDALLARLGPLDEQRPSAPPAAGQAGARALAGRYRSTLGDPSSFLKFAALAAPAMTVAAAGDDTAQVAFQNVDRPSGLWRLSGDDLWLDAAGKPVAKSRRDAHGRITHLFVGDPAAGLVTFARVDWWDAPAPTLIVMSLACVTALLSLAGLAGSAVLRLRRPKGSGAVGGVGLRAPMAVTAALTLVFLGGFAVGLAQLLILHDDRFAFGVPAWFVAVLWLPVPMLGAVCWTGARWKAARAHGLTRAAGLAYGWCVVATVALLMVLWHWNLFGPHL